MDSYLTKAEASSTYATQSALSGKQDTLVSGTSIKTINGESVLGSGNITITGGDSDVDLSNYLAKDNTTEFTPTGDYNPATKKYVDDSIPSTSDFVTTSTLETTLANYAKTESIPDTSDMLTKTEVASTYLTTSTASSTYATKTEVEAKVGGTGITAIEVVTELPGEPDGNTL